MLNQKTTNLTANKHVSKHMQGKMIMTINCSRAKHIKCIETFKKNKGIIKKLYIQVTPK